MARYDLNVIDAVEKARPLWPLLIATLGAVIAGPLYLALIDVPIVRATAWPIFLLTGIGAVAGAIYARDDDRGWVRAGGLLNAAALIGAFAWFFWLASLPTPSAKANTLTEAPDFRLTDQDGEPVLLSSLHRGGRVLIVFYRGAWCPFCVSELRGLSQIDDELRRAGVRIVAISVDAPSQAQQAAVRLGLKFPLLSDGERTVIQSYGVLHRGGGPSGEDVALPAQFLVDLGGRIVWRRVSGRVQDRADPRELLQAVRELAKSSS